MTNNLLEPNYWSIKQLFDYQYNIPVYQRPYSWQTEQVDSLLKDIEVSYTEYKGLEEESKSKAGLYVGNIILHDKALNGFAHFFLCLGKKSKPFQLISRTFHGIKRHFYN